MILARAIENLSAPDYVVMRRVHRWRPPRWVRWWMIAATRGGDGWLWAFCGALALACGNAERYVAVGESALSTAAGIILFRHIKRTVGRRRPCAIEPHCWATLLPPDQFSFPSGHSITAFAVAVPLGCHYPSLLPPLLFCAVSVAASRVLLGMHFLSDVLVGIALGTGLGYGMVCCMG